MGAEGKPVKLYLSITQFKNVILTYDIILNSVSIRKAISLNEKKTINMNYTDLIDDCVVDANLNYYLALDASDELSISVTSVDAAHDAAICAKIVWEG